MAELRTLARPYANAAFEKARADDAVSAWSQGLAALSAIVANPDMAALSGNPNIRGERLVELMIGIGADDFGPGVRNLVHLLVDSGRLLLAPTIAEMFEARRAALEARMHVRVTSAAPLPEAQREALTDSLQARLNRTLDIGFDEDERIIGGAVVHAGDLVIDGSLRAQLERMHASLAS